MSDSREVGQVHRSNGYGNNEALGDIAAEALRHAEWLRDAGVSEVPTGARPSAAPPDPRPGAGHAPSGPGVGHAPSAPAPPAPAPGAGHAPSHSATLGSESGDSDARHAAGTPSAATSSATAESTLDTAAKGCGSEALATIRSDLGDCRRCKLAGGRTHLVFGVGNPHAELMFIGEGPGADEDAQGEPFVGRAGQLLTKMIEAMGFRRDEVYIANVVKCRPPGNRDPEPDEISACEPFLAAQIAAIQPRVIVALGRFAVQTLLRDPTPITRQRGVWREYAGVKLMPTFHPAYLLRNPPEKARAWDDLKAVMKEFGKPVPR